MIDLLTELGRQYRHIREEHDREAPRGATRRRLEQDMNRLAERFERTLDQWVPDEDLRERWRAYLYRGAEQPDEPRFSVPPLFRGRTEAGAMLEIRPAADDGYDLLLDGALADHHEIPWHLDPEQIAPIQIGQWTCEEEFTAPDEAIAALDTFLSQPGANPPAAWTQVLLEDGLIDTEFALTPRGARALAKEPQPEAGVSAKLANFCVLLANTARARVLTLASARPEGESTLSALEEVADQRNPAARARDNERFSDTRPGIRREGSHGPRHGVNDRREGNRQDSERQFMQSVVDETMAIWSRFPTCKIIVVANAQTLGLLRPVLARRVREPYEVIEFPRDLTQLAPAAVHDALAKAGHLPARGRRPPILPMRTPNPWQEGR